jgi:pyridoxamine 5'-phosphate oxidase
MSNKYRLKNMDNTTCVHINDKYFSLSDLEMDCWDRLVQGANKSRSPFHTPCVATQLKEEVSMRTVVLRNAFPAEKSLHFHTDIRSMKWQELRVNPSISALFYDASERIQLRIKGTAELHHSNQITNEAWHKTTLSSRRCYLSPSSPSSFTDLPTSGLTEQIEQENFSIEASEVGLLNFDIVSIHVQSIDWLWLNHAGHRRAFFDYVQGENQWMIP